MTFRLKILLFCICPLDGIGMDNKSRVFLKKWKLNLLSVCALTIFNIWLTFRLINIQSCSHSIDNTNRTSPIINESLTMKAVFKKWHYTRKPKHNNSNLSFSNINFNLGRWDNQRLFKYFDFASIGNSFNITTNNIVCLATQSSVERLHFLVQVANNWNGPISIALYIVGNDEFKIAQLYVTYLRECSKAIADNVNFHLAMPKDRVPKNYTINSLEILQYKYACTSPEIFLKKLLKMRTIEISRYRLKNAYPQNHLRNLGRKGCQSQNVFLTDVDIIPNAGLANQLETFLKETHCPKLCAFVIPTYEIDFRIKFPKNKKELIRLEKKGLARPFHEKVFIYNQYATNFSKWQQNDSPDQKIIISHNVTNYEFLYEPFYVASDKVPIHDERFIGYGFTRNSQVYEMFVSGYIFQVLTPAFTCHWGLQQKKHRPAWREQQNNVNRIKFELFKKEVLVRYQNVTISINNKKKKSLPK